MLLRHEEITNIIEERIVNFEVRIKSEEVGTVLTMGDGIIKVFGLHNAVSSELVEFETGAKGIILGLGSNCVDIAVLGEDLAIVEGMQVRRTGAVAKIPVGENLLGRVINGLGEPLDGLGPIECEEYRTVELKAPGIIARQMVCEPLQTGIKALDSMIAIGRGQRELIIGDRKTGKTSLAIDMIINQRQKDVFCIYVAIGQKQSTVKRIREKLKEMGALDYTVIVSATSSHSAPLQYIAPYAGCAIGEHYRDNGKHALIIYDDLTKHAQAYRQMSLLLRRPPGREAFPGDIFYIHSKLLERAGKLSSLLGGGSLTALPIVETQEGDIAAYIPTNIISITDGQIYLESSLFNAGVRPAINVGISVSRIGGRAQVKSMQKVAGKLRLELAQFRELASFVAFGTDVDEVTKKQLMRGERLVELLKQKQYDVQPEVKQVIALFAVTNGLFDDVPVDEITTMERDLLSYLEVNHRELVINIDNSKDINRTNEDELIKIIKSFVEKK
ncbi:MAG: F0F1 ATP synthase subunit alpha [Bacteriovoracaceae bacterium]|nr:F0F1 ATP synthase subunit alpha [Bacteriovoracaceae bacterium]